MKKQHLSAILLAALMNASRALAQDAASDAAPGDAADGAATNAAATNTPVEAPKAAPVPLIPADTAPTPTNGMVLNFHDVPLTAVLNYLSAKAGLIIMSDVDVRGKVSVISQTPVTTNDVVSLLDDQLGKNGFSAHLEGRTLTIMDAERAKTYHGTPVRVAHGTNDIAMSDQVVTEILPVHTLQAPQLVKDLQDLIPRGAVVTANEAGNSVIMTAPEKDVRRIAEIISSLDGSAFSEVEVFKLQYADAKAMADELKEVFQTDDSQIARANTRNSFVRGGRGGGGGGFGGMFGGGGPFGGGGGGGNSDEGKNVDTHAVFVADDQMNAVIASAPPDYMAKITDVITNLDQPSQEVTMLRTFKLKHADPGEVSDELNQMFNPTSTTDQQNNRGMGMRFMGGFGGGMFGGGGNNNSSSQSARMKRQMTVSVVPDRRTQSILVSASRDMMAEIKGVVEELDKGDEGNMRIQAFDFGGADPATVYETMNSIFASSTRNSSSSTTSGQSPLTSRYTGNANQQSSTSQNATIGGGSSGSRVP